MIIFTKDHFTIYLRCLHHECTWNTLYFLQKSLNESLKTSTRTIKVETINSTIQCTSGRNNLIKAGSVGRDRGVWAGVLAAEESKCLCFFFWFYIS